MAKYYLFPRGWSKKLPGLHPLGWRIETVVIRFLLERLRRRTPEDACRLAQRVFRAIGPLTSKRHAVIRSLYVAFPERSDDELEAIRREIFGNLGVSVAEIVHLDTLWREREARIEFVVAEEIEVFRRSGRPAVFVTAHVGPWTLTNFIARYHGLPLSIVYAPESNPRMDELLYEFRSALGVKLLPRDRSMRALIKELSDGHCVGLGSDVRLDAGEPIPFFGHDMPTNTVPARLALRFGCELIPVRGERLGDCRFRITAYPPIKPADPARSPAEQAADMSRQLNAHFEQWIRAAPTQWMCLARRWPKPVLRAAAANRREPMPTPVSAARRSSATDD